MTPRSNFDDRLGNWLDDGPTDAPGQLLDTILAAIPSIPQRRGAWRIPWRTSAMFGLARVFAGIVLAVGLGSALLFVALRPTPGGIGGQASPPPAVGSSSTPSASPTGSPAATPPPSEATVPTPAPTPTSATTIAPCDPADLTARITLWEGAAGHRIANVELTNAASGPCVVRAMAKPQLVDANGSILIDGATPAVSSALTIGSGGMLKTLVQDGNYCGPAPAAPVSIAFILSGGGRIVATPFSATDGTVPPCLGTPGSAGSIEMHPWAP